MIYRFCDKIKFRFYGSKTKLKTDINSSLYTIWKAWKQSISNLKVSQINKNSKIWSCLNLCYFKMLFTVSIHNELMVLPIWAACCTRKLMIPCPTCCCDRILTLTPLLAWCKQHRDVGLRTPTASRAAQRAPGIAGNCQTIVSHVGCV